MDFVLLYFSGTGNSALITQHIQNQLEKKGHRVEAISIEDTPQLSVLSLKNKVVGFGFPVYKFSYPEIFNKFFQQFNSLANHTPYFIYCTYARFTADCFYDFSKHLNKNQFRLIATRSFKSPSNGISARLSPNDYEYQTVMFFEDDIAKKINTFVNDILHNLSQPSTYKISPKHNILSPIRSKIVNDIENTKYPKLQINQSQCTLCGLCASKCPDQNLLKKSQQIEIIDNQNCLHCLRCMHHCPSNAISFGKLTKGKNRYTFKIRDQLFEKSSNGHKELHWANINQITNKWRKNTLNYWRTHRKHPEIE